MRYAEKTSVSTDSSKAEIEKILRRYGAEQFMSGWDRNKAFIAFKMNSRNLKFIIPLPDMGSREFTHTPAGRVRRNKNDQIKAWDQGCRQRWRALALVIKAKLEAVETGITEFEDEFLAHILLPGGETAGEFLKPQVAMAYETGKMPKLLSY